MSTMEVAQVMAALDSLHGKLSTTLIFLRRSQGAVIFLNATMSDGALYQAWAGALASLEQLLSRFVFSFDSLGLFNKLF
jgi:hypothetical protein